MRGTRAVRHSQRAAVGIIPAYAGNTETDATTATSTADHPRVCGEHLAYFKVERRYYGIIPAYAGNTAQGKLSHADVWDHTRVCGEHMPKASGVNVASGSSPRMRGTLLRVRAERQSTGIIPAYAGNTRCRTGFQAGCGDHPRVCGEHQLDALVGGIRTGSSPRMRGTLAPVIIGHVAHGIIPAYAGNTSCSMG